MFKNKVFLLFATFLIFNQEQPLNAQLLSISNIKLAAHVVYEHKILSATVLSATVILGLMAWKKYKQLRSITKITSHEELSVRSRPSAKITCYQEHPIYLFLSGRGPSNNGETIQHILSLAGDNKTLEQKHDYIQRIFPILEQSTIGDSSAPYLRQSYGMPNFDVNEFITFLRHDANVIANMRRAYHMMINFYQIVLEDNKLIPRREISNWVRENNHNFARLDRMIKSLGIFGLYKEQKVLFDFLKKLKENPLYKEYSAIVKPSYDKFWKKSYETYSDPALKTAS